MALLKSVADMRSHQGEFVCIAWAYYKIGSTRYTDGDDTSFATLICVKGRSMGRSAVTEREFKVGFVVELLSPAEAQREGL